MYFNPNLSLTIGQMIVNSWALSYKIDTAREPSAKQLFSMAAGRFPKGARYPHGKQACKPGIL